MSASVIESNRVNQSRYSTNNCWGNKTHGLMQQKMLKFVLLKIFPQTHIACWVDVKFSSRSILLIVFSNFSDFIASYATMSLHWRPMSKLQAGQSVEIVQSFQCFSVLYLKPHLWQSFCDFHSNSYCFESVLWIACYTDNCTSLTHVTIIISLVVI